MPPEVDPDHDGAGTGHCDSAGEMVTSLARYDLSIAAKATSTMIATAWQGLLGSAIMTREEALGVLESGDFDQFVGTPETLDVEFKGAPYQVQHESQQFELAKDVSGLANSSGGVIIIGVRTERRADVAVDVATAVRPIERGLVDEQQYEAIIAEHVYPGLRELEVLFYPSATDANRGLVAIDVPAQPDVDKYFLIHRPVEEGVDRTPGWLVGISVRGIGQVAERRIGEIHTLINRGLSVGTQLGELGERIGELAAGLAQVREIVAGPPQATAQTPADRLEALIEQRLDEIEDDG
jgi:hypothetical protein